MCLHEIRALFEASSRVAELMRRRGAPEMDVRAFEELAQGLGREG